jgi:hypothetical protein
MIFGKNKDNKFSFSSTALQPYAQKFARVIGDIMNESQVDFFSESAKICQREDAYSALREFFVEDSTTEELDPVAMNEHEEDMNQLFENDRQGVLEAAGNLATFNPVIGMAFPMHKYFMMNNVFDNGGISRGVANTPKFTITMEKRFMTTPDGKEIDLFYEQSAIKDAFDSTVPFKTIEMTLPEQATTNLIDAIGAGAQDHIAVESYISGILATVITTPPVYDTMGSILTPAVTADVWIDVNYGFTPGYGDGEKRYVNETIKITNDVCADQHPDAEPVGDYLSAMLYNDQLVAHCTGGNIKAIRLTARKDTSNGLVNTCSVKWKTEESLVEIGTSIPINIPVSPEEIKDVQALYGVNQLTKLMSMIKDVMGNWKDDSIKQELDKSYATLHKSQKFSDSIDFALKGGYLSSSPVQWRHDLFMDQLDTLATDMIQVWNDPNVDITVIGRTDLIRKTMPITYTTGSNTTQGGVALDFKKTVVTTDNRRYEFISTDKIRKNLNTGHWSGNGNNPDDLIILLKPRGTNRIMYMVYDYQLYIANDIRNAANPTLPAIHAFDRWKFYEYQPVQGRVTILNSKGF